MAARERPVEASRHRRHRKHSKRRSESGGRRRDALSGEPWLPKSQRRTPKRRPERWAARGPSSSSSYSSTSSGSTTDGGSSAGSGSRGAMTSAARPTADSSDGESEARLQFGVQRAIRVGGAMEALEPGAGPVITQLRALSSLSEVARNSALHRRRMARSGATRDVVKVMAFWRSHPGITAAALDVLRFMAEAPRCAVTGKLAQLVSGGPGARILAHADEGSGDPSLDAAHGHRVDLPDEWQWEPEWTARVVADVTNAEAVARAPSRHRGRKGTARATPPVRPDPRVELVVRDGGVAAVIASMFEFPRTLAVQMNACEAVCNLARGGGSRALCRRGAVRAVSAALDLGLEDDMRRDHPNVAARALAALACLIGDPMLATWLREDVHEPSPVFIDEDATREDALAARPARPSDSERTGWDVVRTAVQRAVQAAKLLRTDEEQRVLANVREAHGRRKVWAVGVGRRETAEESKALLAKAEAEALAKVAVPLCALHGGVCRVLMHAARLDAELVVRQGGLNVLLEVGRRACDDGSEPIGGLTFADRIALAEERRMRARSKGHSLARGSAEHEGGNGWKPEASAGAAGAVDGRPTAQRVASKAQLQRLAGVDQDIVAAVLCSTSAALYALLSDRRVERQVASPRTMALLAMMLRRRGAEDARVASSGLRAVARACALQQVEVGRRTTRRPVGRDRRSAAGNGGRKGAESEEDEDEDDEHSAAYGDDAVLARRSAIVETRARGAEPVTRAAFVDAGGLSTIFHVASHYTLVADVQETTLRVAALFMFKARWRLLAGVDGGLSACVAALHNHPRSRSVLQAALQLADVMTQGKATADDPEWGAIYSSAQPAAALTQGVATLLDDESAVLHGLAALHHVCQHASAGPGQQAAAFNAGVLNVSVLAMSSHEFCVDVQRVACHLLFDIVAGRAAIDHPHLHFADVAAECGAAGAVIEALRLHSGDASLHERAKRLLPALGVAFKSIGPGEEVKPTSTSVSTAHVAHSVPSRSSAATDDTSSDSHSSSRRSAERRLAEKRRERNRRDTSARNSRASRKDRRRARRRHRRTRRATSEDDSDGPSRLTDTSRRSPTSGSSSDPSSQTGSSTTMSSSRSASQDSSVSSETRRKRRRERKRRDQERRARRHARRREAKATGAARSRRHEASRSRFEEIPPAVDPVNDGYDGDGAVGGAVVAAKRRPRSSSRRRSKHRHSDRHHHSRHRHHSSHRSSERDGRHGHGHRSKHRRSRGSSRRRSSRSASRHAGHSSTRRSSRRSSPSRSRRRAHSSSSSATSSDSASRSSGSRSYMSDSSTASPSRGHATTAWSSESTPARSSERRQHGRHSHGRRRHDRGSRGLHHRHRRRDGHRLPHTARSGLTTARSSLRVVAEEHLVHHDTEERRSDGVAGGWGGGS